MVGVQPDLGIRTSRRNRTGTQARCREFVPPRHLTAHSIACHPALTVAFRTASRKYPPPRFHRLLHRRKASSAALRADLFCGLLDRLFHRLAVAWSALLHPITWRTRRRSLAYFNLSVVHVRQQLPKVPHIDACPADWAIAKMIGLGLSRAVRIDAATMLSGRCHRSRASFRRPQCLSFRVGSNTRST
jgi:hypothetical protein